MGLFNCGGRFYQVTNLSDSSDQLAVTNMYVDAEPWWFFFEIDVN